MTLLKKSGILNYMRFFILLFFIVLHIFFLYLGDIVDVVYFEPCSMLLHDIYSRNELRQISLTNDKGVLCEGEIENNQRRYL